VETAARELRLPLKLSFKDANNRAYEERREIIVPLYSQAELEKYGFATPQGIMLTVLAAIILLFAAYFVYAHFLKKKK
jgi:hypothetical protein